MSTQRIPDNVHPIWTPRDAVDTAQEFHRTIANAERGSWLVSQSRPRRAAVMDLVAVVLLLGVMAGLGAVVFFTAVAR